MNTTSKISLLEKRIQKLEKQAGLLDIFDSGKNHLIAISKGVAKHLKKYNLILAFGEPSYTKSHKQRSVTMPLTGAAGNRLSLIVRHETAYKNGLSVILRGQNSEEFITYLDNFHLGHEEDLKILHADIKSTLSEIFFRQKLLRVIQ